MDEMITQKQCGKCKIYKPFSEFCKSKDHKYGLGLCKRCDSKKGKKYYADNVKKVLARVKKYRELIPEIVSERSRIYYKKNIEKISERHAKHREENKERLNMSARQKRSENPEKYREKGRKFYTENRDSVLERQRKYRKENKEHCREKAKKSAKKWRDANPERVRQSNQKSLDKNPGRREELGKKWRQFNIIRVREKMRLWALANPDRLALSAEKRRAQKAQSGGTITAKEWKDLKEKYHNRCLCCGRTDVRLTMDHVIPLSKGGSHTIENCQCLCGYCNSSKHTKSTDYRPEIL